MLYPFDAETAILINPLIAVAGKTTDGLTDGLDEDEGLKEADGERDAEDDGLTLEEGEIDVEDDGETDADGETEEEEEEDVLELGLML